MSPPSTGKEVSSKQYLVLIALGLGFSSQREKKESERDEIEFIATDQKHHFIFKMSLSRKVPSFQDLTAYEKSVVEEAHVAASLGAPVSSRTIRRRLAEGHLRSRCPLSMLPLTPTHRRLRLEWYHKRRNWTAAEWNQVVFSDESGFNLSSDDNRVREWRPRGELLNPAFALQRHTTPTAGVMVWGAIAFNIRSPLVLIRGTMTAKWYVHDILQPHVLPLMQRLSGAIFQQDNARPHMARVSQDIRTVINPSLACSITRLVSN
ncbi:transposable element Tcb2 transposase [Trichonephila clavipes]|nr:transposable element Tcb2 transposase [Trichonephila clavipes]